MRRRAGPRNSDSESVFQSGADGGERGRVACGLHARKSVAGVRGEQPGEVFRLNEGGAVREGAAEVFAKSGAYLTGECAGRLRQRLERLLRSRPSGRSPALRGFRVSPLRSERSRGCW